MSNTNINKLVSANKLIDQLNSSSEDWGRLSLSKEQLAAIRQGTDAGALIANRGRRRILKSLSKKVKH